VATGRERRGFDGHYWSVESLAFAANGKTLVSTGRDATALIWDLTGQQSKTPPAPKLTAAELKDCWTALAGDDAALAYKSIHRLAAAPADAVPFLQKHLSPVAAVDQKRLTALVADLASDTFKIREAASKELFEIGEAASGHMRQVLAGKITLEQKRRIEVILEKLAKDWDNPTPTQLQKLRALESLELAGTPQALELLKHIAGGAPGARITVDAQGAVLRLTKN
jgi:hypothetical protein